MLVVINRRIGAVAVGVIKSFLQGNLFYRAGDWIRFVIDVIAIFGVGIIAGALERALFLKKFIYRNLLFDGVVGVT